ncbi:MAG TPA: hydroxymethylglutaryl-CoA lyase [Beijerinckiaceae bacterium]|jgi:hydroxymethylglutaryl-CoA lyase
MSDLPKSVQINEEGPREGFQIEPGPIATNRKIALIDALSQTGLNSIQVASFVNPKRVPGWADADAVVEGFTPRPGVRYTALWLNEKGLERALSHRGRLAIAGSISLVASEPFVMKNQQRSFAENAAMQRSQIAICKANGIPVEKMSVMAAFGCNYAGDITAEDVVRTLESGFGIAHDEGLAIKEIALADTMAWATPESIKRTVGAVRERWPEARVNLHLHDTRGLGIANAYAGLEMGVDSFDSAVAGLGGCPFAGHKGAAGNVCTEDLVFMCEEMGIATGVDLDALIEAARLAEEVVAHPLPGAVMRGGTLDRLRANPLR